MANNLDQANESAGTMGADMLGGFDALRILEDKFTIITGRGEYTFETPRDTSGRITAVNGNGKNREVAYE